jgi:hypothetical protein
MIDPQCLTFGVASLPFLLAFAGALPAALLLGRMEADDAGAAFIRLPRA